MRIIIAGSRRIPSLHLTHPDQWLVPSIKKTMIELLHEAVVKSEFSIETIISGHCWGVDQLAEDYAIDKNIPLEIYPANWLKYGKRAGFVRNEEMAEIADGLICMCCENSKGSLHMIEIMKKLNKPYFAMFIA